MNFSELSIDPRIQEGITKAQFVECTEVQAKSYEITLKNKDVLVQSQTGSGKTAAFLIPIFESLLKNKGKALIIAPTRELVVQIEEECNKLGEFTGLSFGSFFGGTGYEKQEKLLAKGIDIYIGTPGRLMDFNKSKKLNFADFTIMVIDEADRLFDMGFYPDIQFIMKRAKQPNERQTMLFSATLSLRVRQLAWQFMNEPTEIEIESDSIAVEEIEQTLFHVSKEEKFPLLLGILKRENPSAALIFTNTKNQAAILSQKLVHNGYKSLFMSGDLPQHKRIAAINKMKEGELQILTATDVAARGLHIDDLPLVINYDIPEDSEVYVHRIGRTARAGKTGKAITFACERFVFHLEATEDYIGKKIPVDYVEDELLLEDLSIGKPIHLPRDGKPSNNSSNNRQNSSRTAKPRTNYQSSANSVTKPSTKPSQNINRKRRTPANSNQKQSNANANKRPRQDFNTTKRNQTPEQRRAHYASKYGEAFTPVAPKKGEISTKGPKKRPKKGFFVKILSKISKK